MSTGCRDRKPTQIDDFKGTVSTNCEIILDIQAFRLPKGLFYEFSWELKDSNFFELEIADKYCLVPIPEVFSNFENENRSDLWIFEKKELPGDLIEYNISHKYNSPYLKLTLPFENGKFYSFAIFENDNDEYFILLGTLTNYIKHENDQGIFCYFVIKDTVTN